MLVPSGAFGYLVAWMLLALVGGRITVPPGTLRGFAVRVDGAWRLERIDVFTNTVCRESAR